MADVETAAEQPEERPLIRIDAAHPIPAGLEVKARQGAEAVPVESVVGAEERAQVHAAQLARHLQERRRDVDHRESQLNARIAQLESELRGSRLWLQERTDEFSTREAELARRLAEQESHLRGLTATELAVDDVRRQHQQALQEKEEDLRRREEQLAANHRRLVEHEQLVSRRHLQLDEQEQSLEKQWAELHRQREILEQDVAAGGEELLQERKGVQEKQRQLDEQVAQQKIVWEIRQRQFDERQIALERIRQDIMKLHRNALEMRLVAEQLWSQMTGRVQPVELTKGVANVREQFADEFRFAQQEISCQQTALESLIGKLDAQRNEIGNKRDELVRWLAHRQRELAQQSEMVNAQEKSLARERRQHQQQEQAWHTERGELQRQIRQLALQIRRTELAAA